MSGRQRLQWAGIGSGAVAVVIVAVGLVRYWWPGWSVLASWLETWWWMLAAAVALVCCGVLLWASARRLPSRPASAALVAWEQVPGQLGLIARTAVPVASTSTMVGESQRKWNWSAISSAVTAFTALAALVFTAQSLSATRDQINVSEQGQITDRYTKAIDQIGAQGVDRLEIRLGGIYALERLAKDSPRDQPTIVEVLAAFVRGNAPAPSGGTSGCSRTSRALDVQAALTVLGRRDPTMDAGTRIDLDNSCLAGVDLFKVDLAGADLVGADLAGADLQDVNLAGADLGDANLVGADLSIGDLHNANLVGANLHTVSLGGANLQDANLHDADLGDADLGDAELGGANLAGADLSGAHLDNADLNGAITER